MFNDQVSISSNLSFSVFPGFMIFKSSGLLFCRISLRLFLVFKLLQKWCHALPSTAHQETQDSNRHHGDITQEFLGKAGFSWIFSCEFPPSNNKYWGRTYPEAEVICRSFYSLIHVSKRTLGQLSRTGSALLSRDPS